MGYTNQFSLRLFNLVMQATQYIFGAFGVVVLHKIYIQASGFLEGFLIVAFKEEASVITEDFGLDKENIRDASGRYLHE